MPYDYLTINDNDLNKGITSASYLNANLQSLYEQKLVNEDIFYGESDDDLFEFTLYNNNQQLVSFNRVVPSVTYSVLQGSYRDINNVLRSYRFANPFTNIVSYKNDILLHPQFDLNASGVGPGLYYLLYNPVRNIAGNPTNRLVIKEISPSRTEIRLSYAFDTTKNESSRLDTVKITSFADKKYLLLRIYQDLIAIIKNNPIEQDFLLNKDKYNYVDICLKLGLKSEAELQEFITSTYVGYNTIIKLNNDTDNTILQTSKFSGIQEQINNFIYTYNNVEFTSEDILESFRIITLKVSQDRVLQKSSVNDIDLQNILGLFEQTIYTDWILPQVTNLLENYKTKYYGYYKNALNFDNGNLIKILDHTNYLNPTDDTFNIQVKLDAPLPLQYNVKTTCWISNISIAPIYFKANLFTSKISRKVFLNDINFDVQVNTVNPSTQKFDSNDVFTLDESKIRLKEKYNDLYIDYTDFNNFINYSSAELRTKIAKNKIKDYNQLESVKKSTITSSLNTNDLISSSYSQLVNQKTVQQITLLDTFDEYESYLFFNSSSIDDKIDEAITYDSNNYNSLVYQLPEYVKDDSDSADYIKFTAMVGHFFDNILVFIKKFPKAYPISNDDSNYYPKNYIDELLNSFSWNIDIDKFSQSDLNQLYFNNQEIAGYNSASYFDYTKSILNRFANNISSVYKSKGTVSSFEMIRTMFGIPAGIISTREYGSADSFSNRDNYFVYDDIIYMTDFKENNFLNFEHTSSDFIYTTSSYYASGSNINTFTSSTEYSSRFNGISTIEFSLRFKSTNYNFGDKIQLLSKHRNEKSDWNLFVKKSKQSESGQLIFEIHPYELGNTTSSLVLDEMPLLNGNIFTVMLKREPVAGNFEKFNISSSKVTNQITPFIIEDDGDFIIEDDSDFVTLASQKTTLTSSNYLNSAKEYIPYVYSLSINQYDGSVKNFSSTKRKIINNTVNKNFSSGSYYIGNYSSSVSFIGNLDKIKILKEPLDNEYFDEHSYNLDSISIPNKEDVYSNLFYLWSFDTPVDLYSPTSISTTVDNQNIYYQTQFFAYNFGQKEKYFSYPTCSNVLINQFPYQFDKINVKQTINTNNFGPNYKINSKINKITETALSNLTPYDYSTRIQDSLGDDSILSGFFISPYNYLNHKIENFIGLDGIADIIGEPENLNKQNYAGLTTLQRDFGKINEKYIYPQEFYSTYKFYIDFSIFDVVQNLKPARSNLLTGILLEPSLFERKKFNYRDVEFVTNNEFNLYFNNKVTFTSSLINTNNTSSFTIITSSYINNITKDENTYNYSRLEIKDTIDDRDFIYAKYGKYVYVDPNGYNVRDTVNVARNDYYQSVNNNGIVVTFTSSFDEVQVIGSGSGYSLNTSGTAGTAGSSGTSGTAGSSGTSGTSGTSNYIGFNVQVTGSKYLKNYYKGVFNTGYSNRHLSKFSFVGSRAKYQAISGSKTQLVNGLKLRSKGDITYYTYIKGKNDQNSTVNRDGVTNGSAPVITIPGFLSLNIETNNAPIYGDTTGSIGNPDSLFIQLPLTASLLTSASLERYIMNL